MKPYEANSDGPDFDEPVCLAAGFRTPCLRMKIASTRVVVLTLFLLIAGAFSGRAQWETQSIVVKPGWNAVFLNVDASHTHLNALVGGDSSNPIQEVWRWNSSSVAQFTTSPAQPSPTFEWISWNRTNASSALQRLTGDSAYLVRVGSNVTTYTWSIKGRPVAPRHEWTISGLNLIGFSTAPNSPPNFKTFLAQATEFQSATPEIYHYPGGDLGANNPVLIASPFVQQLTPVNRGQAFWVRSGTVFNRYFGPFEVLQSGAGSGVDFRETSSSTTFRLRNLTTSSLTVTLRLVDSEPAPAGQAPVFPFTTLLLRGSLNLSNLTYGYTNLPANSPRTWTLTGRDLPGSEVEVVLGLNRAMIANPPGSLLAGVLRFTDSLGHSQVEVPVSAKVSTSAGLWVGTASIDKVGQYLLSYARGTQTTYHATAPNGSTSVASVDTNALVLDSNGRYVVTATNTQLAAVTRPFEGRLILHNPTNGNAVLMQRAYSGFDPYTNIIVATGESALSAARLKDARRISSTFLPWTAANTRWTMSANLGQPGSLATTVTLPYDDQAANPFVHTYHPDHDNRNATFDGQQARGLESYTVQRDIMLTVVPATDFSGLVAAAGTLSGNYEETITLLGIGGNSRQYHVSGAFVLNRISHVPTLTIAP
jgi:hypothetical protein